MRTRDLPAGAGTLSSTKSPGFLARIQSCSSLLHLPGKPSCGSAMVPSLLAVIFRDSHSMASLMVNGGGSGGGSRRVLAAACGLGLRLVLDPGGGVGRAHV